MQPHDVPPQLLHPEPLPLCRRRSLSSATFWALMDRWKVPTERALRLIGHDDWRGRSDKPKFGMSEEQAKVLSCLLEIDLTLAMIDLEKIDCIGVRGRLVVPLHWIRWADVIPAALRRFFGRCIVMVGS